MAAPAIGVFLPTMTERGETLPDVSRAARHIEDLGFESAWAVDQLVAGTGVPFVESTVALGVAAAATTRVRLAYGVLILPLRPVVWVAKQVASLQTVSGNRVLLGIGVGGDRHDLSWEAAGVPRNERGRRTDAALAALPGLIAGQRTDVGGRTVQLAPGAVVPPIIVGGMAQRAFARAAAHGDGWFAMPGPAAQIATASQQVAMLAAQYGRPAPAITGNVPVALDGDPKLPDRDRLIRRLSDPDGMFGMPPGAIDDIVVTGGPAALADQIGALHAIGAERVVVSIVAGDWRRQAELVAEAVAVL